MDYILVTGAAGFIGSHLCERLLSVGYGVVGIDNFDPFYPRARKEQNLSSFRDHQNFKLVECDVRNGCLNDLMTQYRFKCVVHLAGKVGVRPSIDQPQEYIDHNISATLSVLEAMKLSGVNKYIFASSSSIYGNMPQVPWSETLDVGEPISPYAFSKRSCELLNYSYHHLYKIDNINLRFFTVYGPRQRPDLAIAKFFKLINDNKPISIYGDGSTKRDYTFISDIIDGIVSSINYLGENDGVYEIINLGNGNPVELNDLVKELQERYGDRVQLKRLPEQPGDVKMTSADISKAKRLICFNPSVDFRSGIRLFEGSLL